MAIIITTLNNLKKKAELRLGKSGHYDEPLRIISKEYCVAYKHHHEQSEKGEQSNRVNNDHHLVVKLNGINTSRGGHRRKFTIRKFINTRQSTDRWSLLWTPVVVTAWACEQEA